VKNNGIKTTNGVPNGTVSFTSNLNNLEEGIIYYYQAYLTNGNETTYGTELSFSTLIPPSQPTATTTAATSVTNTAATLNGTVNANNQSTTVTFDYGLTSSYGSTIDATPNTVTGNTPTNVSASLTGLSEGTLYHYRVKTVTTVETINGGDLTFTTNISNPDLIYVSSVVQNASPTVLEMTYNLTLANVIPAPSAFTVMVNSVARTVNAVAISGTKVILTLASAVNNGDIVTVAYTKPATNPIQTASGGQAASISAQNVTINTLCAVPSATTNAATNIAKTTTTFNGIVNASNFSTTVAFEYGSSTSYGNTITATQSPVTGSNNTTVSVGVIGLSPNTVYHYRVKAVNCGGTVYGNDQFFTTLCNGPSASAYSVSNLGTTTVTLNGQVNPNGCEASAVFEYGLTTSYGYTVPALPNIITGNNTIIVSASIAGLTPGTTYYFRVKAVNSGGTSYGENTYFTTSFNDNDGNVYHAQIIGTQVWMKENLKTTKYNDNSSIPNVTDNSTWAALTTPAYCWYNNDYATYKATYGALYNWYTVNTGKLCPQGWHMPTDADWTTLTDYLGGISVAGGSLKEAGTTHWNSPNTGASNYSGFTALPGGYHDNVGFASIGLTTDFWSTTEYDPVYSMGRDLRWDNNGVTRTHWIKNDGFSVRCLRDY
jgi:uncharacterized protein (TIGR02145 family)/uncharacterized repeat protein (TIGR02059 family)